MFICDFGKTRSNLSKIVLHPQKDSLPYTYGQNHSENNENSAGDVIGVLRYCICLICNHNQHVSRCWHAAIFGFTLKRNSIGISIPNKGLPSCLWGVHFFSDGLRKRLLKIIMTTPTSNQHNIHSTKAQNSLTYAYEKVVLTTVGLQEKCTNISMVSLKRTLSYDVVHRGYISPNERTSSALL